MKANIGRVWNPFAAQTDTRAYLFGGVFGENCKYWEFLTPMSDHIFREIGVLRENARILKPTS